MAQQQENKFESRYKASILPNTHIAPKIDPRVEPIPAAITAEIRAYLNQAHVEANTVQLEDASNDEVDDDKADDGEPIDDADCRELVNNEIFSPFDQEIGPTGETRMYDGVLFSQYSNCHHELYYESCEIYVDNPYDSKEAIKRLANSGEVSWTNASPLSIGDDSTDHSDFLYHQYVIDRNKRLAYLGMLDNCEDVGITECRTS